MSASHSARRLAVAFVMTTALAACKSTTDGSGSSGQPPQPQRPRDANGVPLDLRAAEVTVDGDGKCWWEPEVNCPEDPEISCNPPAPMEVTCPDGVKKPEAEPAATTSAAAEPAAP